METLNRQQKRSMMRTIEKKRFKWRDPNWQRMKFIDTKADPLDPKFEDTIFRNDIYTAISRETPNGIIHLSIRNKANSTEIPWTHKQQIKNDICGKEREAIEIFPAMSRIVDAANQYHLWVFPVDFIIPTGFPAGKKLR